METAYITSLVILSTVTNVVDSIRLNRVGVPNYAIQGKQAVLECPYDLEGSTLYSVKWYKNGREFFRFLPKNPHPMTVYVREGVEVDKNRSNERSVTLTNLVQSTTGRYRCEVSTEGPTFATVSQFGDLLVVVLPKKGPLITGGKLRYSLGDNVDVNCTSANSKPAAEIKWLINGEPASREYLVDYPIQNSSYTYGALHTAVKGLRFQAQRQHFSPDEGDMKLKCTASIGTIYWKVNEKSAEGLKSKRDSSSNYQSFVHDGMGNPPPALDSPHGLSSGWSSSNPLDSPLLPTLLVVTTLVTHCANIWLKLLH